MRWACAFLLACLCGAAPVDSGWGPNLTCVNGGNCTRSDYTIYQNTSGKLRRVTLTFKGASGAKLDTGIYVGPLGYSQPLEKVTRPAETLTGGTHWPIYFEVPDQHYYATSAEFGDATQYWYEKDEADGGGLSQHVFNEALVLFGAMALMAVVALAFLTG